MLLNTADQNCTLYSADVMLVACVMTSIFPVLAGNIPSLYNVGLFVCLFFKSISPLPDHIGDSQLSCDQARLIFPFSIV